MTMCPCRGLADIPHSFAETVVSSQHNLSKTDGDRDESGPGSEEMPVLTVLVFLEPAASHMVDLVIILCL